MTKISEKLSTECYYIILETSNHFIKVVEGRHSKWNVFQKQTFQSTSTIYLLLRCSTEKQIQPYEYQKKLTLFLLLFSQISFLFDSRVFNFFVFFISPNKLNCISRGICLSFTGIFLGLWLRGSPCNFTEQLFFLHSYEWLLPII